MIRKIIINLITALVFFPLVLLSKDWKNILYSNYQYYDTHYTTLKEYISVLLYVNSYPLTSFIFLIFILLPFQLIKDYHYKKGEKISYIKKVGILSLIIAGFIIFIGTFTNIWTHPWWHNFIHVFYSLFLSLIFTTILYFLIDRYVERSHED